MIGRCNCMTSMILPNLKLIYFSYTLMQDSTCTRNKVCCLADHVCYQLCDGWDLVTTICEGLSSILIHSGLVNSFTWPTSLQRLVRSQLTISSNNIDSKNLLLLQLHRITLTATKASGPTLVTVNIGTRRARYFDEHLFTIFTMMPATITRFTNMLCQPEVKAFIG